MEFYNSNAWSNNLAIDNEVLNNFLPNNLDDQIGGAAGIPNIPLPPPLDFEAPLNFNIPSFDSFDPILDILPCPTNGTFADDYIQPQDLIFTGPAQPTLTNHESSINSFTMEQNQQQNSWNVENQHKQSVQSSNIIQEGTMKLEIPTSESGESNHGNTVKYELEQNLNFKSANYKWLDDGYNWRKCGNKQIKKNKSPKSYFRCTYPNCPGRKTIETSLNGLDITIVNTKPHNHQPVNSRRSSSLTYQNDEPQAQRSRGEDDDENEIVLEVREAKVVIQVTTDNDVLDDGYKWRKYGQKVVKGNPNPRSYYKCTSIGCLVKKQVERAADDPKDVITTYEGRHNHDFPATRDISRSTTDPTTELPSMATFRSPENYMNSYQNNYQAGIGPSFKGLLAPRYYSRIDQFFQHNGNFLLSNHERNYKGMQNHDVLAARGRSRSATNTTTEVPLMVNIASTQNHMNSYLANNSYQNNNQTGMGPSLDQSLFQHNEGMHNRDVLATRGSNRSTTNTTTKVPLLATTPSTQNYMNSYQNNNQSGMGPSFEGSLAPFHRSSIDQLFQQNRSFERSNNGYVNQPLHLTNNFPGTSTITTPN